MKRIAMAASGILLFAAASMSVAPARLFGQQPPSVPAIDTPEKSIEKIVAQSQEALSRNDDQLAMSVVQQGFSRFPDDENLRIQMARVYVFQKHDRQAIGLLNAILLAKPASRNAKLALAEVFGYRDNYNQSDRLYRELLSADPADEAASLGLIHNLVLEGKRDEAVTLAQQALRQHPNSLALQQYSDYLAASPRSQETERTSNRLQITNTYFADTSGNRSFYSSQTLADRLSRNLSSNFRMEETTLWTTGSDAESVTSGFEELQYRWNKYTTVRAGAGAVRFADSSSYGLFAGDLDLQPLKNLTLSGGYSQSTVVPTLNSVDFDLRARGWRSRVDYRLLGISLTGTLNLSRYSDGNHAEHESGEALRWFSFAHNRFSIAGGYSFQHAHFAFDPGSGYFSPDQYRSHLGATGFRLRLGKHYRGEFMAYGGVEQLQAQGDYSPGGEVLARNDFYFGRWSLSANYSHFQLVQTTGAFRADSGTLAVGYRF